MIVDQLAAQIDRIEDRGHYVAALLAALGDPSQWTYTGQCIDAGTCEARCACGHDIRWCFVIEHPERGRTQVGSTCITHIGTVNPELGAALSAAQAQLEADLAAQRSRARRAAADAQNQVLWQEYAKLRDEAGAKYWALRGSRGRVPRALFLFVYGYRQPYRRSSVPEYTRAGDLKRWLNRALARVREALAAE